MQQDVHQCPFAAAKGLWIKEHQLTCGQRDTGTYTQAASRQTDEQTYRQTDKPAERQTDQHTEGDKSCSNMQILTRIC